MPLPSPAKSALRYARRVLKAADQFANVLLGGEVGETITLRVARLREKSRFACLFCRLLDLLDKNHCDKALT